ncbi:MULTISPECIES: hypothetical protein [unclassified Streptomyces]|uniref:hypothetical protein n=1 Tax=unclassified Streptomyces TaxID=2593676 RepID=UPI003809F6FB
MAVIDSWESVNISLIVAKEPLDTQVVCDVLGIESVPSRAGVLTSSGSNWWTYTYGEEFSDDLESKVVALVDQFQPRLAGVGNLLETGHAVQLAIEGSVGTGSQLFLSPWVIGKLASLAVPISVTSLTDAPEEDPLSWLDD